MELFNSTSGIPLNNLNSTDFYNFELLKNSTLLDNYVVLKESFDKEENGKTADRPEMDFTSDIYVGIITTLIFCLPAIIITIILIIKRKMRRNSKQSTDRTFHEMPSTLTSLCRTTNDTTPMVSHVDDLHTEQIASQGDLLMTGSPRDNRERADINLVPPVMETDL